MKNLLDHEKMFIFAGKKARKKFMFMQRRDKKLHQRKETTIRMKKQTKILSIDLEKLDV